jgi:hypothetical protein
MFLRTAFVIGMVFLAQGIPAWAANKAGDKPIQFDELVSAGPNRTTHFTASGVADNVNKEVEYHGERHNTDVGRRRASMSTSSSGSSGNGPGESSRSSQASEWRCEFLCGKSRHSVVLKATDKSDAQDRAMQHGKKNCWAISKQLYEPMLGRIADCSKQ